MFSKILQSISGIRPERFFTVIAIFMGVILTLVVPPIQSPDDLNHFFRTYQISRGSMFPQSENNRLGGEMPYSFRRLEDPFKIASQNEYYRIRLEDKLDLFHVRLDEREKEFRDFPNTSYYSPVSYMPQAIAVFVLRQFDASLGLLYYGGKLFVFVVWLISMRGVIKLLPICKWLFTLVILFPMNVYISNSFSADIVTNVLSLLLIAFIMRLAFSERRVERKDILFILILVILLALSKIVYVGLVFLILIIPAGKFKSMPFRWILTLSVCFFGFLAAYLWTDTVMKFYIPHAKYNPQFTSVATVADGADYYLQKDYLLNHGSHFLKVIYYTLVTDPGFYLRSYIIGFGTYLHLFAPWWLVIIAYLFVIFVALTEEQTLVFSYYQKAVIFLTVAGVFILLLLSQYLTWNPVGYKYVDMLQGRYLIPLFPLIFLLFTNSRLSIRKKMQMPVMIFSLCVNLFAARLLYCAYIKDFGETRIQFFCGAEETDENGFFKTTNPDIHLENGRSQTNKEHRTGKYSTQLSLESPYTFTFRFKDLDHRDLVEVEAWQKGEGGVLAFTNKGKNCKEYFMPLTTVSYKEKNGWGKMHMIFSIYPYCKNSEAGFYIYNSGKSNVYFDDVTVRIKRFKKDFYYLMPGNWY